MVSSRTVVILLVSALPWIATCAAQAAVEISSKATKNIVCSQGVCTPTRAKAILNVTDLANMLSYGNVTIKSDSKALDIDIDAALSWTSTSGLTLDSYRSIAFNKPVTVAGTGALTITTNDGGSGGDYRFFRKGHVEFWDTKSLLTINGQWYKLADSISELKRLIRQDNSGRYALAKDANAHWKVFSENPLGTFDGLFEGLGNTISNFVINDSVDGHIGLFHDLLDFGVIRDLHLKNASVTATVAGAAYVGVLVGGNGGTIQNCDASGQITLAGTGSYAGGLVGIDGGRTINSGANVSISGAGAAAVGGLVGRKNTFQDSGIDQSFSTGVITAGDGSSAGGLVGVNYGDKISNSYAGSSATAGTSGAVGGLVGTNADDPNSGLAPFVSTSYSIGAVSAGAGSSVGGLIGSDANDSMNSNDYWDLDTSNINDPSRGAGNIKNDPGITGLTDAQLKSGLPAGFDPKIWGIDPKINNGYPYLLNNPSQ